MFLFNSNLIAQINIDVDVAVVAFSLSRLAVVDTISFESTCDRHLQYTALHESNDV